MSFGYVQFFILAAFLAFTIWGIIDAVSRPSSDWKRTGHSKVVWVVLQVVFGTLGTVLYVIIVRSALIRVRGG